MKHLARGISIVFHPLWMASYVLVACMLINPYLFGVQDTQSRSVILISVFLLSFFFPVLSILMMKALGLIKSLEMKERSERIGPMIATGIFYLWLYLNIRSNTVIPGAYTFFVLGAVIAMFVAFFINTFDKISLHALGAGGLLTAMLIIGSQFSYGSFLLQVHQGLVVQVNILLVYVITILISGLTLTSRLILNAHTQKQLYGGFLLGVFSQLIAYFVIS